MSVHYRCLPVIFLMTLGAASSQAAEKSEAICKSGDTIRRVVVEVGDLGTSLPCEVVYWKDNEAPGVRRVLWNARSDAAFCDAKAAGLVNKLSTAGWNCGGEGQAAGNAAATPTIAPAPTPSTSTVATASPTDPAGAPDAAAVGRVVPAAEPQEALQPETTAGLAANLEATAPSTPAPEPAAAASTVNGSQEVQTAAVEPAAAPATGASLDQLQTVIEANLSSLNQTVDGDFQAQIGEFGDLDNDGIDDAVVFFNYESSTADFTQFVAAYLFNGKDYHLAATKPVGGTDLAVRQVEVENIVEGSIQLRLVLNDASQSENRRAAMILKDGQLVEIQ